MSNVLSEKLFKPIEQIKLFINAHQQNKRFVAEDIDLIEFKELFSFVKEAFSTQEKLINAEKKNSQQAKQVAHDIRSPVTALNVAIQQVGIIPEKQRLLIKSATERINDIANNLLAKNSPDQELGVKALELTPIAICIDNIISEKRLQLNNSKKNIQFATELSNDDYFIFVEVQVVEFMRLLSNLLNNAIEAIAIEGIIDITLDEKMSTVRLAITDNGCGIPNDKIDTIFDEGVSFNKKYGSGLGLAHAKKTLQTYSGNISCSSQPGLSTIFTITLPTRPPPIWFCKEILLENIGEVIIVDDDPTIHKLWHDRLNKIGITYTDYFTPMQLEANLNLHNHKGHCYFFDYEFIGHDTSGLDLIEKHNLSPAYLMTSHYNDQSIIERCRKRNIKLLPKSYVPFVKLIRTTTVNDEIGKKIDAVLIDDNEMILSCWQFLAESRDINLSVFRTIGEFETHKKNIAIHTPIYIDSDLQADIRGELYAKQLFEQDGFTNLYLCTGYSPSDLSEMSWLQGVLSKEPPF